ncbi:MULTISPECIES: glycosyltransferase family 39 protein [Streptomyces]|uniref:glycosyltransferase family 39 protein n=1 Tax=Streptomyces TaxID=1883 RepID=UPI001F10D117|nr:MULTISPECIES: glycosyltransferase family 39 protein [Streptomyces]
MAVMLAIGLWGLDRGGMWGDESVTFQVAQRTVPQIWRLLHDVDAVHGLYYLFMHAVLTVHPDEVVLRLPAVCAATVTAGLVAALGVRLAGPRAGLGAGVLYAITPMTGHYAQEGRSYALVAGGVAGATLLLLRAVEGAGARAWWGYGTAVALTCALHELAVPVLGAHALTLALLRVPRRVWSCWGRAAGAVALLLLPLVWVSQGQAGQVAWLVPPGWDRVERLARNFAPGPAGPVFWGALLLMAVGLRERRTAAVAVPLLLVPPGILMTVSQVRPLYHDRYVLYSLAGASLLVAAGAGRVGRALGRAGCDGPRVRFGKRWVGFGGRRVRVGGRPEGFGGRRVRVGKRWVGFGGRRVRVGKGRVGVGGRRVRVGRRRVGFGGRRVRVGKGRVGFGGRRVRVGKRWVGFGGRRVRVGKGRVGFGGRRVQVGGRPVRFDGRRVRFHGRRVGFGGRRMRVVVGVTGVLALTGTFLVQLPVYRKDRSAAHRPDNLAVVSALAVRQMRPGDPVLFLPSVGRLAALAYPMGFRRTRDIALRESAPRSGTLWGREATPGELRRRLASVDRVWVVAEAHVLNPRWSPADPVERTKLAVLRTEFTVREEHTRDGVVLRLHVRRQPGDEPGVPAGIPPGAATTARSPASRPAARRAPRPRRVRW